MSILVGVLQGLQFNKKFPKCTFFLTLYINHWSPGWWPLRDAGDDFLFPSYSFPTLFPTDTKRPCPLIYYYKSYSILDDPHVFRSSRDRACLCRPFVVGDRGDYLDPSNKPFADRPFVSHVLHATRGDSRHLSSR